MLRRLIDFITLYPKLMRNPRTPMRAKYLPCVALAYLIFPLDIVPDLLPILGQADDITVIIMLISLAVSSVSDAQYDALRKKRQRESIDVEPIR